MPVQRAGQQPAEQHADAAAARADEAVDAHRLGALRRLGEQIHDERQRDRRDDRAAEPLHGARDDQHRLRRREPAGERRQREQRDADHQHGPAADDVRVTAGQQHAAAEGQQVGVDEPGQVGLRKPEVLLD